MKPLTCKGKLLKLACSKKYSKYNITDGVLQYTFSNFPNSRGIIPMQTSPENDKPLILFKETHIFYCEPKR